MTPPLDAAPASPPNGAAWLPTTNPVTSRPIATQRASRTVVVLMVASILLARGRASPRAIRCRNLRRGERRAALATRAGRRATRRDRSTDDPRPGPPFGPGA